MARVYTDGAGTTYDAANAKFTDNTYTTFTPFNFSTLSGFAQKADNSVAGEMRDCGECHVGGGFMEYYISSADAAKPFQYNPANRTSYRAASLTGFNAFNTFIDIFGVDGLGFEPTDHNGVARDLDPLSPTYVGPTYAAKTNDFSVTGALEMDCLMCHLEGYSWENHKAEVRKGNFDSSRAVGAGLGTAVDGRNVTYNVNVTTNENNELVLAAQAASKIVATPKSDNCASCHQSVHNVDWKKRGEVWQASNDVHYGFGCMACHERKPSAAVGTSGLQSELLLGQCDPAKGGTSPFDALWNKVDNVGFKKCDDCHTPTGSVTWNTYGAPNADQAHQAAGLKALLLQASGEKGGVATKSHIDIIDCTACHTKNKAGITGGAFVDGTGADMEGRVATHDNPYVEKDMANGLALHWLGGKLYSANLLTSFFWRDMNDVNFDANNDGRGGGMDALLQTHVAKINFDNNRKELSFDGVINTAEISERQTMVLNGIEAVTGLTIPLKSDGVTKNFAPRISMLTVPFKATHNVSPSADAWGKPTRDIHGNITAYGCDQCHGDNKGFYNGAYPINGKLTWTFGPNQLATFTKVNGKMDATEGHPNVLDKHGKRTVAFQLFNPAPAGADQGSLRNIDRSEVIYETTFKAPATAVTTYSQNTITGGTAAGIYGSSADAGKSTKGHVLKIDVADDAAGTNAVSRTWMTTGEYATVADVITAMGSYATGTFNFTVTSGGSNNIVITPTNGKFIKLNTATDFGPYGLGAVAYAAAPQKGTLDKTDKAGRSDWVAYLNGITADASGIGVDPVASITNITDQDPAAPGIQVYTAAPITLTAADAQVVNSVPVGASTYTWSASDGTVIAASKSSSVAFASTGTKTITLTVTDEEGKTAVKTTQVIAVAPSTIDITWVDNGGNLGGTATFSGLPTPNDKLKIMWGDGQYQYVTTTDASSVAKTHTYATAGSKLVEVYIYKSGVQKGYVKKTITVDGAN